MRIGIPRLTSAVCVISAATALFGCGAGERATDLGDRDGPGLPSSAAPSAPPSGTAREVAPEGAPRQAENRGWRQRAELSPADRAAAEEAAERIRGALAPLRGKGEFAPEKVASAIENAGFPPESITTEALRAPLADTADPPKGAVFGVHVGDATCVVGTIRPDRLEAEPKGAAAEYGCLEPATH